MRYSLLFTSTLQASSRSFHPRQIHESYCATEKWSSSITYPIVRMHILPRSLPRSNLHKDPYQHVHPRIHAKDSNQHIPPCNLHLLCMFHRHLQLSQVQQVRSPFRYPPESIHPSSYGGSGYCNPQKSPTECCAKCRDSDWRLSRIPSPPSFSLGHSSRQSEEMMLPFITSVGTARPIFHSGTLTVLVYRGFDLHVSLLQAGGHPWGKRVVIHSVEFYPVSQYEFIGFSTVSA